MSWSVKVAGRPGEALAKFTEYATTSWGYKYSVVEKENIDQVISYLAARVSYFDNGVPTTIVELEGSGHWDDASGQGNCMAGFRILTDRRKS